MKHYLINNEIRAIEEGQEFLVKPDWVLLSDNELYARLNPPKTEEQLLVEERAWRNSELAVADIEINKLVDIDGDASLWRAYRVSLRDYPQQEDFPNGTRPINPMGV